MIRSSPETLPSVSGLASTSAKIISCNAVLIFVCTLTSALLRSQSDDLMEGWSDPVPVLKADNPDAVLNGAGHNGEIITDRLGRMFMVMHTHCNGLIPRRGSYNPRPMMVMELMEVDGRLTFVNHRGEPTTRPEWIVRKPQL